MALIVNAQLLKFITHNKLGKKYFLPSLLIFSLKIGCLIVFISCSSKNKTVRDDFPYLLSFTDNKFKNYNFNDTLVKYIAYNDKNCDIVNKTSYYSFMSNLYSFKEDSVAAYRSIMKAIDIDKEEVCKNFIHPMCNYLNQERPGRRKSIPPFLNTNFSTFLNMLKKCDSPECLMNITDIGVNPDLYLRLKYISLLDQWYRIPERKMDAEVQNYFDAFCRRELNQINESFSLNNNVLEVQSIIYVILLHSDDCEWSKTWLHRYYEIFKDSKFIDEHLRHFVRRSDCIDSIGILEMANNYIDNR